MSAPASGLGRRDHPAGVRLLLRRQLAGFPRHQAGSDCCSRPRAPTAFVLTEAIVSLERMVCGLFGNAACYKVCSVTIMGVAGAYTVP